MHQSLINANCRHQSMSLMIIFLLLVMIPMLIGFGNSGTSTHGAMVAAFHSIPPRARHQYKDEHLLFRNRGFDQTRFTRRTLPLLSSSLKLDSQRKTSLMTFRYSNLFGRTPRPLLMTANSDGNKNRSGNTEIGRERKNGERRFRGAGQSQGQRGLDTIHILQRVDDSLSARKADIHEQKQELQKLQQPNKHEVQNRRLFVSSVLLSTSLATLPPQTNMNMNMNVAHANEITWSPSPINKRSGITLNRAENTYNLKFITYLSRFLLSFDKDCQQWWMTRSKLALASLPSSEERDMTTLAKQFGSFAASVEIGLQEYEGSDGAKTLMKLLLERYGLVSMGEDVDLSSSFSTSPPSSQVRKSKQEEEKFKNEIKEAKRQIALLFSLLDVPYQPVEEITKLLASIDNASIKTVSIVNHGGGYAPGYGVPAVIFPKPDAVTLSEGDKRNDKYETATGRATLRPSGRILRIDIRNRGFGYSYPRPPKVTITPPLALEAYNSPLAQTATAKAIIFRDGVNKGRLERVEVTFPGSGYDQNEMIKVQFSPPELVRAEDGGMKCSADVVLEYELDNIEVTNPGSGYVKERPIEVYVDPPPLTARLDLNDPMVVKKLSFDGTGLDSFGGKKMGTHSNNKPTMKDENDINSAGVFDPSSLNAKAWNMAKSGGGGGCVGRACYDDPVVAIAYPTAEVDSYSSFRSSNTKAGGRPPLPFWNGSPIDSSSLFSLLPSGIGLSYNNELKKYELVANDEAILNTDMTSIIPGEPIDADFGPRGVSPIEREKSLTPGIMSRFFISGALCSSAAHLLLTPLDVVKTSIQTNPTKYTNPISTFKLLLEENGVTGLFAGWVPTLIGFFINGGVGFALTEFWRSFYFDLAGDIAFDYEIPIIVAAAATAAIFGSFTLAPSEAIRIRSVAQPDYAPNALGVATRMISDEGVYTLFSAVPAFLLKEIPFCIAKFGVFDSTTAFLFETYPAAREDFQLSLCITLIGGTLGGISAAIVSNPADATVSAMKKAKSDDGPITTFLYLFRTGGVRALSRGLGVRMFFYTILVALQFLVYDAVRFSFGIASDDLKLYLDVLGGALRETGGPI